MEEKNEPMIPLKSHMSIMDSLSKRSMTIYIIMCICWTITLSYSIHSNRKVLENATSSYFNTAYDYGTITNTNTNLNVNGVDE